jgi:CheY-like chemotaxis protein
VRLVSALQQFAAMRIAVKRLIRQERTPDGGCSLVVMADLGETVRAACTIVLSPREAETIAEALHTHDADAALTLPASRGPRGRVLIVDDEPILADILGEHLAERGYETETAVRGEDAIDIVAQRSPDVVLLDITMPGIDGVTVLRRIQELDLAVPVIMVTGNGDEVIARETLRLGAFDYITKPVGFDRLDDVLSTAIAMRGQQLLAPHAR